MTKYIFLLCLSAALCPAFAGDVQTVSSTKTIAFIENRGQVTDQYYQPRHDIDFKIDAGNGLSIFVGSGAMHYQFYRAVKKPENTEHSVETWTGYDKGLMYDTSTHEIEMYRMDVELVGANMHSRIISEGRLGYYENYYTTGTGETGVTVYPYTKITYKDVYPNIDWVLYTSSGNGAQSSIKYDFVVHPGGNPADIKLSYHGATSIKLNADGSITAMTPQGDITEHAPVSYQGDKENIASKYVLQDNVLSFDIGEYSGTLVIDPTLEWGTYFGGASHENGNAIALDNSGNIYIVGDTRSIANVATIGAFDYSYSGITDGFIAKFDTTGNLSWATYYGGDSSERCDDVAMDNNGDIIVLGITESNSTISTIGSFQDTIGGATDLFLAKFDTSGSRIWSTYYGGDANESHGCLTTDSHGNIYIGGGTQSWKGMATVGSYKAMLTALDGFVTKFNSIGNRLWGTYYGGENVDEVNDIVLDKNGNIYVVGTTNSDTGIASIGAFNDSFLSTYGSDAFLVKFDSNGRRIWGTYYGGTSDDGGYAIAIDDSANIFITGKTTSAFGDIATNNAFQGLLVGNSDAFLAKFDSSGSRIWGTYYGSSGNDAGYSLSASSTGDIYLGGELQTLSGFPGGLTSKFDRSGIHRWSMNWGHPRVYGNLGDYTQDVIVDSDGSLYVMGTTLSTQNIATSGTHKIKIDSTGSQIFADAFIIKFCDSLFSTITGSNSVCIGGTIQLQSDISNGSWVSLGKSTSVSNNGIVNGISYGTDSIGYVFANKCMIDTSWITIDVDTVPIIFSNPSDISIVQGNNVKFSVLSGSINYQWQEDEGAGYQNLNNNGQYSGVNTNTLTVSNANTSNSNSKYRCIVVGGSCSDTSGEATLYVWPLGIGDLATNSIKISPNPTKGTVTISSMDNIEQVQVLNLYGQVVMEEEYNANKIVIDLSRFSQGIYIIRINNSFVYKIVKE